MHRLFRKDQIFTVPNVLSIVRLLMIPIIVWLYCGKREYGIATVVILLSGATDIVDGFIARKFNMVSDLGKILDPIADKVTQIAVIICLTFKYKLMLAIVVLFAVKEMIMGVMGYITLKKKDQVNGAKWYGKLNTVVLYAVMMLLILIPDMSQALVNMLIIICACMMLLSLLLYVRFYRKLFSEKQNERSLC